MSLRPSERRTFRTLLHDAAGGGRIPIDIERSELIFEAVLAHADPPARAVMRLLLFIFEWLPFLLAGPLYWGRYSKKSESARFAYIEAIRGSRLYLRRAAFKALTSPVLISHYGRNEVQVSLGYDAASLGGAYRALPAPGDADG